MKSLIIGTGITGIFSVTPALISARLKLCSMETSLPFLHTSYSSGVKKRGRVVCIQSTRSEDWAPTENAISFPGDTVSARLYGITVSGDEDCVPQRKR